VSSSSSTGAARFLAVTQLRIVNHILDSFLSDKVTKHDTAGLLSFIHVLDDATQNVAHSARKDILILKLDIRIQAEIRRKAVRSWVLELLRIQ
jgi:hypothetical protein